MCSGQSCSGPLNLIVGGPDSGRPLTIEHIHSHVYCSNAAEGSIELSISGGLPSYKCIWSTGDTTEALYNLLPGMYSVTVTDATNCSKELSVNIFQQHPINQSLYLVDYESCGTCYLNDNQETYVYSGIDYLIHAKDLNDGVSMEEIEVCLNMRNSEAEYEGEYLMKRNWEIRSSNAKSRLRLFFEKDELESLSDAAGYNKFNPPSIENSVSVYQFIGGDHSKDDHESVVKFEDLKFYKFGPGDNIWYVEIEPKRFDNNYFVGFELALKEKQSISIDPIFEQDTMSITLPTIFLVKNPVDQFVQIGTEGASEGFGEIIIYDRVGNIKHVEKFEGESLLGKKAFVGNYKPGFYMCVIRYSDRRMSKAIKFIKI